MRTTDARNGGQDLIDRLGRPYTATMHPGYRAGRPSPNLGRKFPAEILTADEVGRVLERMSRRAPSGLRNRALVVVMWRAGLRISEALALELRDLNAEHGTLTIRHGKGDKRRVVGLDPQASAVVELWLEARRKLLGGRRGCPVFCTISFDRLGPGRPLHDSYVRELLTRVGRRAGVEKRVHPHGFRHTHAVELLREGMSVKHIQTQLGHSDLSTTARYLDHLLPAETVELMRARAWPEALREAA